MSTARIRFTAEDRREQILTVATDLFARQGFNGTTTRHIAEAAEVNEALIFRHFPSKEELYWAVLERKCKAFTWQEALDERLSSGKTDREVFQAIASDILERRRKDPSLGRLLLFSALENHTLSDRFFRTNFAQYYDRLADHIRQRIRVGAFRKVDPMLAARGFLGMINYHFQIQELFGGKKYQKYEDAEVTASLTDLWLHGMVAPARNGNATHKDQAGK
jgi:TetR/AcrR family transcriptional regulator